MHRLAIVLAYFVHLRPGQGLPTSTVHLQSFPIGGSSAPLKAVDGASRMLSVDQANGCVRRVRDEGPFDLMSQLATLLLAFNNPVLSSRSPVMLNRNSRVAPTKPEFGRWQKQFLKMQEDFSSFTVPQLKKKLKEKGLPVSGKKAELIARLEEHTAQEEVPTSAPEASGETTDDGDVSAESAETTDDNLDEEEEEMEDMAQATAGEGKTTGPAKKSQRSWLIERLDKFEAETDANDPNVSSGDSWLIARLAKLRAEGKILKPLENGSTTEDAAKPKTVPSEDFGMEDEEDDLENFGMEYYETAEGSADEGVPNAAPVASAMSPKTQEKDLGGLKVSELKEMLKGKGLPVSGKKAELIARLEEHTAQEEVPTAAAPKGETTDDAADLDEADEEDDLDDFGMEDKEDDLEDFGMEDEEYDVKDFVKEYLDEAAEEDAAEEVPNTAPIASRETMGDASMSPKTQEKDLGGLTVAQLKEMLKANGLPVSGKKAELIARLEQNTAQEEVPTAAAPVR